MLEARGTYTSHTKKHSLENKYNISYFQSVR